MSTFEQQFNAAVKKQLAYAKRIRNKWTLDTMGEIIDKTPHLTGALKGSWHSEVGAPSTDSSTRLTGTDGAEPKAELKAAIERWPSEGSLFMTNRERHAEGVEFDGWASNQAPMGMVRVVIAGKSGDLVKLTTGSGRTE